MESREDRKRKALRWSVWTLAVVAGLLILAPIESRDGLASLFGPLFGAGMGASLGAYLTNMFTRQRRIEEEDERRRVLATMLLSEIQLLYFILKDVRQASAVQALHTRVIEPFHTAMYDRTASDRLLFQSETTQVLVQLYSMVSTLRLELNQFRELSLEQRTAAVDFKHAIDVRTVDTAKYIPGAMRKLRTEGGAWPIEYPRRSYRLYPEDPEALNFPPFPTENGED